MSRSSPRDDLAEEDERLIQNLLTQDPSNPGSVPNFDRDLEPGEKADDAVDFADLSDDDLAEDEDESPSQPFRAKQTTDDADLFGDSSGFGNDGDLPDLTSGSGPEGDGFDDLFGDMPESPRDFGHGQGSTQTVVQSDGVNMSFDFEDDGSYNGASQVPDAPFAREEKSRIDSNQPVFRTIDFSPKNAAPPEEPLSKEQLLQQQLFAMSGSNFGASEYLPPPPENREELLESLWPKFERDAIPRFMDLLPPKKARYIGRTPSKLPKPLHPTKLNLDIAPDQDKSFKISAGSNKRTYDDYERDGLTPIRLPTISDDSEEAEEDIESDYENEPIGGVTWQDLQIICEDWDVASLGGSSTAEIELEGSSKKRSLRDADLYEDDVADSISKKQKLSEAALAISSADQDDIFRDIDERLARQKTLASKDPTLVHFAELLAAPQIVLPPLRNPEHATAQIAKSVTLDLNDPRLLLEMNPQEVTRVTKRRKLDFSRSERIAISKSLFSRYNISNDDAYDLLKRRDQSKIRSTLGNLAVSHSMPALRLQYPYYKTRLAKPEARSFHRPSLNFHVGEPVMFSKTGYVKKKHLKGKGTKAVFEHTKDLSLADNSSMLLLEYSEEYPAVLSNFGMGSRLINYYRRKTEEETERPKFDVGETAILMPQDKSPLTMFGHIDPGEVTPTIHNGMYRAPVFKQATKSTDFLVIRNTTGIGGSKWYLRNVENLHVVGQEFPARDVPGPHSRRYTTAIKNRLKMIAYRRIKRNKPHRVDITELTQHTEETDMQNRQKLKEFMIFSKEHKAWELKAGEAIPDEETVRNLMNPEEVCLLESMQVGNQSLLDAGYVVQKNDDDEAKEGQSIEVQLAPWFTSKNFLNASQGKAMLQLHGEGDPTGRGEGFSFIKTSMKGGFKAVGESVEDKLDAQKLKELGGHSYNVARQQKAYEESIRRIWEAQKKSLSSTVEISDDELDEDDPETAGDSFGRAATPRSASHLPAQLRRRDDETGSQFSKFSTTSQSGKVLRITRDRKDEDGNVYQEVETVEDPRVIREYLKRRHQREAEIINFADLRPTGDAEQDRRNQARLEKELARLERNKERRIARDKQKGIYVEAANGEPGSPSSAAPAARPGTTQRKCANCGQVGHIKTNKKFHPEIS